MVDKTRLFRRGEDTVSGRAWHLRDVDEDRVPDIARKWGVDSFLARLSLIRGIKDMASFMRPSMRDETPDPYVLVDMKNACERAVKAIENGEKIAILGDYDVDGMASVALLQRYLNGIGIGDVETVIPDRLSQGYGPNTPIMQELARKGVSLVVTIDCGIGAKVALEKAQSAAMDVIIVDHHAVPDILPSVFAVVDPKRQDDTSGLDDLCAGGLALMFVIGINRCLRGKGYFKQREEPNLMRFLDLAAMATICDMVPLVGFNRVIVARGLKVIDNLSNPGIRALADTARVQAPFTAADIAFSLGPRLNACGRIGHPLQGVELLSRDDGARVSFLANRFDNLNRERQKMERVAMDKAERENMDKAMIFVSSDEWHPGIIGLVAGRLCERFRRPACVFSLTDDVAIGSARSGAGINIGALIHDAKKEGLIDKGGGHAQAGGMTLSRSRLVDLRHFFDTRLGREDMTERMKKNNARPIVLDARIPNAESSHSISRVLQSMEPFGMGNPAPRIVLTGAILNNVRIFAHHHIGARLRSGQKGNMDMLAFRSVGTPLGQKIMAFTGTAVDVVGFLRLSRRGYGELHVHDIAVAKAKDPDITEY